MNYKNLSLAFFLLFFVSCTTTQDANEGLRSVYIGKSTDEFFIQNGPPSSNYKLDSGKTIYIWAENPIFYNTPSQSNTSVNVIGGTAYANTTTSPGSTITVQCQVKIISSEEGIIERIEAHGDTIGNWELSRCAEVFRIRNKS